MSVISVSAGALALGYMGGETDLKLRIYCRRQFITSDLDTILRGALHTDDFYQEVDCDVSGTTINHDAFDIDSTLDGTPASSWYLFAVYTAAGDYVGTAYKKLRIPDSPSSRTLASIALYNQAVCADLPNTYYTAAMIDDMLDDLVSTATPATELVRGVVKMSAASLDVDNPIAVSQNDPYWRGIRYSVTLEYFGQDQGGLDDAIASIATDYVDLIVTTNVAISDDTSIPANVHVKLEGAGSFTVASTKTLTINSIAPLGNRRYFYGDGDVVFGRNAAPWFHLNWWAKGLEGTGDSSHAFEQAFQSMTNQGDVEGGGILHIGAELFRCNEVTLPQYGTIVGSGRDPNGTQYSGGEHNGTTIKPYSDTADYIFNTLEANRFITLENLTISTIGDPTTVGVLLAGDTQSGFMFRASRCSFQCPDDGVPAVKFIRTASNHWETTQNYFDHCWFQAGENNQALYVDTVNSTFTFNTCELQIAAGGTGFHSSARGWWMEIATEARGAAPITSQPYTANRSIASCNVTRTADDLENDYYSTIELDAGTPAEDLFVYNDISQRVEIDGGGNFWPGFEAYIVEILDPFTARLSIFPRDSPGDPADYHAITGEAVTIQYWDDPVGPATSVRTFENGNMASTTILGGIDEGFNYSMIYNGQDRAMVKFVNYQAQGKIKITSGAHLTLDGGTYLSCGIMDESAGPVVIINALAGTIIDNACGNNLYTRRGYLLGRAAAAENRYVTRVPIDYSTKIDARNADLSTYALNNEFRVANSIVHVDSTWGGPLEDVESHMVPMYALGAVLDAPGSGDDQKRMLRWGKFADFTEMTWEAYYDSYWSDYTNRLEFDSSISLASLAAVKFKEMAVLAPKFQVEDLVAGNGFEYMAAVCGTETQITSGTTGVTLNKLAGSISVYSTSLAAGAQQIFTVTNSMFDSYKGIPDVCLHGDTNCYFSVRVCDAANGSFKIAIKNEDTGTQSTGGCIVKFWLQRMTW